MTFLKFLQIIYNFLLNFDLIVGHLVELKNCKKIENLGKMSN